MASSTNGLGRYPLKVEIPVRIRLGQCFSKASLEDWQSG